MKTELITNVSHDLKTPLTSIINYVGLLKNEGVESENAEKYLDVIDKNP
ncbi:MAG: histidine kinase dimerization/phospho-acceptor domain-containing protein [Eubacterium sp.]